MVRVHLSNLKMRKEKEKMYLSKGSALIHSQSFKKWRQYLGLSYEQLTAGLSLDFLHPQGSISLNHEPAN